MAQRLQSLSQAGSGMRSKYARNSKASKDQGRAGRSGSNAVNGVVTLSAIDGPRGARSAPGRRQRPPRADAIRGIVDTTAATVFTAISRPIQSWRTAARSMTARYRAGRVRATGVAQRYFHGAGRCHAATRTPAQGVFSSTDRPSSRSRSRRNLLTRWDMSSTAAPTLRCKPSTTHGNENVAARSRHDRRVDVQFCTHCVDRRARNHLGGTIDTTGPGRHDDFIAFIPARPIARGRACSLGGSRSATICAHRRAQSSTRIIRGARSCRTCASVARCADDWCGLPRHVAWRCTSGWIASFFPRRDSVRIRADRVSLRG